MQLVVPCPHGFLRVHATPVYPSALLPTRRLLPCTHCHSLSLFRREFSECSFPIHDLFFCCLLLLALGSIRMLHLTDRLQRLRQLRTFLHLRL